MFPTPPGAGVKHDPHVVGLFVLPGLANRREDIEPNIDFELRRHARDQGYTVRFNVEARRRYVSFATGGDARWPGNFRQLSASITRMACGTQSLSC